jgi:hypothetical protein
MIFWHGYRDKRRWNDYWARLGCWISSCYGPFSLCMHFETYEPFVCLIYQFFPGRSKPWILNQRNWGHNCIVYIMLYASLQFLKSSVYPAALLYRSTCSVCGTLVTKSEFLHKVCKVEVYFLGAAVN